MNRKVKTSEIRRCRIWNGAVISILFSLLVMGCRGESRVTESDNHRHEEDAHAETVDHGDHDHDHDENRLEPEALMADNHDEPDGHDHGEEAGRQNEADSDHQDDADGHDLAEEEPYVEVSDSGMSLAGIATSAVTQHILSQFIELPGEIGFNEDRLAHITPRYGGVITDVRLGLGEFVDKGEVLAIVESNQSLTAYEIRAPLRGRIVEKHAIPGEYVSEEVSMFVIADLSSVWVNLDVYPRHLGLVSEGRSITVRAVSLDQKAHGIISYVAPLFDTAKRAAVARVVLVNKDDTWRPGMFVKADMEISLEDSVPAIEKDAVQIIEGEPHIFIPDGPNRFRPVEVILGQRGRNYVEISSGVEPGAPYVNRGAFELKAKMVTSSLGAHAGHGH